MGNFNYIQENPLINEEKVYTLYLETLFNEIIQDLEKMDKTGRGKVSEDALLSYLQSKLPSNKQLNVPLFKQLLQNIDRNIDMNLDLNVFCKNIFKLMKK